MGRIRKQPERDLVLNPCRERCKKLVKDGCILQARRLDAVDTDHKVGSPDIEIQYIKDDLLYLLLVECKRPDGKGVHRGSQKRYRDRYIGVRNVVYVLVEDVCEMAAIIEHLTGGFYNKKMKALEL